MSKVVYLNGECIPAERAVVSVYNGGWLHGAGLFETMRAENGCVFRLDAHLDRLCASAERLVMPVERSALPDDAALRNLLERNGLSEARVRLTVSAGNMLATDDPQEMPLTVCATVAPLAAYPQKLYDTGIAVLISKYRQSSADPLAGHKTTNYLPRLIALRDAQKAACLEALWFTPENLLAEGSISNVFIVTDGKVATPPIDTPVLPGIARALVLQMCTDEGTKAEERPININDLLDADEAFLTNSIMQVMPICRVERRDIGEGEPGPVTRKLFKGYRERVVRECLSDG